MKDLNRSSTKELNNNERSIVNLLKLQPIDRSTNPPTSILLSDVQIAAETQIRGGTPVVGKLLKDLESKGIVARDKYDNWGLVDRVPSRTQGTIDLNLELIRLDGGTQPRAEINKKHVLLLEEQIEEGAVIEAIVLNLGIM